MMNITPVVKQLLIINIIFFIGSQIVPNERAYELFSLYYPESDKFRFWQPLTHMFMHAPFPNIMHIVFNMFGLVMFGSHLERFWGAKRFIFFYIVCGLGAALVQLGVNYYQVQQILAITNELNLSPEVLHKVLNVDFIQGNMYNPELFNKGIQPILLESGKYNSLNQEYFDALYIGAINVNSTMVGASGAIYGLLAAFAFILPNVELLFMFIPFPIKAKYFVPALVLMDLFSGVTGFSIFGGGVAHFAHVGGALFGLLLMLIWRRNQFKHNRWN
jgi:membrane associated rhomboid family serine protease